MSDCQSWFGSARSNRCWGGPGLDTGAGTLSSSPSSWRIRLTVVSETPRPSKRAITSRMRRVPCSGCARRVCTTASRRGSAPRGSFTDSFRLGAPSSAHRFVSAPYLRYRRAHSVTVVAGIPKACDTVAFDIPRSTTACAICRRTSGGHFFRPDVFSSASGCLVLGFIPSSLSLRSVREKEGRLLGGFADTQQPINWRAQQ